MPRLRKIFSLVRVMLRTFSFDMAFQSSKQKKGSKIRSGIFLGLLLIFCLGPLAITGGYLIITMYDVLSQVGMQSIVIQGFTSVAALIIFVFGLANVMAVFYYAGDTERYLSCPVKPTEILSAKFITTVIYEYIICFLAVLPIYCIYGIKSAAGPLFYLYGVLSCALLPIIPIALSAAIVMLLMRFTRVFRNRDAVNMVFMLLLLVLILTFQMSVTNLAALSGSESQIVASITEKLQAISGSIGNVFIGTGFASAALINSATLAGLGNLLAFIACTAVIYVLFLLLGQLLYFKGVLGLSQTATGKKTTLLQVGEMTHSNRTWASIMKKDLRIMLRTPVFFLNNIFMIFFLPVFLTVLFTIQGVAHDPDMAALQQMLQSLTFSLGTANSSLALFGAMGAGALMGAMNSIAGSALSREGSNFNVMKVIPVSYSMQIAAKTGLGYAASVASSLFALAIVAVFLKIPLLFLLLMLIPLLIGALLPNLVGILIELHMPKLHWTNEQMAVKQNLNVLLEILSGFALAALSIAGGVLLVGNTGLLPMGALLICIAVGGLLNLLLYILVKRAVPGQMERHSV